MQQTVIAKEQKPLIQTEIIDPIPIPYNDRFSKRDLELIQAGFVPRDMDDKWVIHFVSPYLHLHRSWTGQGVYRVELVEELDCVSVLEATCAKSILSSSNPQDQSDMLEFLIGNLLLKRKLPFPNPKNIASEHPGLYQHVISGTGYPENKANSNSIRPWWKIWR